MQARSACARWSSAVGRPHEVSRALATAQAHRRLHAELRDELSRRHAAATLPSTGPEDLLVLVDQACAALARRGWPDGASG
jgi:hypothetical protein